MTIIKHTTDEMVADVKRRASLPSVQSLFTDQDIVDFLDEELHNTVVPLIMNVREEYFVTTIDIPYEKDKEFYDIPERAVGTKLRDIVMYTDENGTVQNIPRWSREMISARNSRADNQNTRAFFVQGNQIGMYPTPNQTGTMQFSYFLRPGHLVLEAECVQIIDKSTLDFPSAGLAQLESANTLGKGLTEDGKIDLIHARAPFTTQIDIEATFDPSVGGTSLTDIEVNQKQLDEIIINNALGQYGDWMAQAGQSPVAQVPLEGHYMIVQAATIKVLESMGSERELKVAQEKYAIAKEYFLTTISDRVEGESKKVVGSNNIMNHTRSGSYSRSGWWG